MPKKGYGQSHKLALFLGVHTTLVSQVLNGLKTFTLEQAALVCDFLGLTELETEFFLLLVQQDRAGNESLKKVLRRQIAELRAKSAQLSNRLQAQKKLSEEARAVFYSDWTYSAVRQLTAIKGYQNLDAIAEYFDFSKKQTKTILDFLLSTGLCKEEKGKIIIGPSSTHLEASSPWVRVHHANWRQQALQHLPKEENSKLHYTAPLTVSVDDALKIREMIVQFLEKVDKVIDPSPSEEVRCLNIDWFKV
jgi:uncharacterized protein (TIGR02147 family)